MNINLDRHTLAKILDEAKTDLKAAYNSNTSAYRDAMILKALGRVDSLYILAKEGKCE